MWQPLLIFLVRFCELTLHKITRPINVFYYNLSRQKQNLSFISGWYPLKFHTVRFVSKYLFKKSSLLTVWEGLQRFRKTFATSSCLLSKVSVNFFCVLCFSECTWVWASIWQQQVLFFTIPNEFKIMLTFLSYLDIFCYNFENTVPFGDWQALVLRRYASKRHMFEYYS